MNTKTDKSLDEGDVVESALREMTQWRGPLPRPGVWERAVEEVEAGRMAKARRGLSVLRARIPAAVAAVLAVAAIGVLVTAMMPSVGRTRQGAAFSRATVDYDPVESLSAAERDVAFSPSAARVAASPANREAQPMGDAAVAGPAVRSVIRKATIELKAADVRVAAQKAGMLINEAGGEYVQESAVRGEGEGATAQVVLRVAASRLSGVLESVRALGEVTDESASGTDVTGQVVDLEARLRNERRVEVELLELLEKRVDAPLTEVLELREQIARVRSEIERLTAQRDQLSRLVSLATVLVVVRGGEALAPQSGSSSILPYFGDTLDRAWRSGVRTLTDSLGFVVRIAVGGLPWWILAAVVLAVTTRWSARRQAHHQGRTQPAA